MGVFLSRTRANCRNTSTDKTEMEMMKAQVTHLGTQQPGYRPNSAEPQYQVCQWSKVIAVAKTNEYSNGLVVRANHVTAFV